MGIKEMMAAVMTFGAVALGSATASAYTPSRDCETVVQERVVSGHGRRAKVVTTTTRVCSTPRVKARRGKVVLEPAVRIAKRPKVKRAVVVRKPARRKVVKRRVVVRERSRPKTVVNKTTTTRKASERVSSKRAVSKRRVSRGGA